MDIGIMIEKIVIQLSGYIMNILINYYIFVFSVIAALFIMAFKKPIDYFIMKNDTIWRRWYKGKFRCPSCLKKLKPHDYPPNYICIKCGGIHTFGNNEVREWRKNKPIMTRGEFIRYLILLGILALSAFEVFNSRII